MSTQSRTQALLQAMNGTQAEFKAFIESIPNDKEYQEYKAAHPEPDTKWQGMTREQKNEYLVDLIMQLAEKEAERVKQEKHNELKELLRYQNLPTGETWDTLREYYHREKANPDYKDDASKEMFLALDMFEYGRICGIRQERARRRGESNGQNPEQGII